MTKKLGIVIVAMLAALAGVVIFVFSGAYDIGADAPHWEITRKMMEVVRDRSIEVRASRIALPNLQDEQLILKGAGQYAAMCANCHLAPEQKDTEIRPGLYPKPPNLSEQRFDPKIVFWVIKHGLKMTGMPAWGVGHDDATLWSIVAFVTKLPGLSADHYKELVASAPPDEEMGAMNMDDGQKSGKDKKSGSEKMQTGPKGEHRDSQMEENGSTPRYSILKAATIFLRGR